MKFRAALVLLIPALMLTGCGPRTQALEESVENKMDAIEDTIEHVIDPEPTTTLPTQTASEPSAATSATASISREQAEAIALEHAGFTADQVTYLHTDYEIDDGIPQYEIEFHQDRWEYDYEINAENGDIISFSRDD